MELADLPMGLQFLLTAILGQLEGTGIIFSSLRDFRNPRLGYRVTFRVTFLKDQREKKLTYPIQESLI